MVYTLYIGDWKCNEITDLCICKQKCFCRKHGIDYVNFGWSALINLFPEEGAYFTKMRDVRDTGRMRSVLSDWFRFALMTKFPNRELWYLDSDIELVSDRLPNLHPEAEIFTCYPNAIWYARAQRKRFSVEWLCSYLLKRLKKLFGEDGNGIEETLCMDLRDVIGFHIVKQFLMEAFGWKEEVFMGKHMSAYFRHRNANSWKNEK